MFFIYDVLFLLQTQYTFQVVFDEYTSQKALYDHTALPLVDDLLHGKNGEYVCQPGFMLHTIGKIFERPIFQGRPQYPTINMYIHAGSSLGF